MRRQRMVRIWLAVIMFPGWFFTVLLYENPYILSRLFLGFWPEPVNILPYTTGLVSQIRSAYSFTARSAANRSAFAILVMDMCPHRIRSV